MKRGFLGPIGDDLPSLIPLVFALIIFFYSFTFAWNIFNERSSSFNDNLAVLELASTMRGNSYLGGTGAFQANCTKAKASIKRIKFSVGLVALSNNPLAETGSEHFQGAGSENFFAPQGNPEGFLCSNSAEDVPKLYSVRFFPVALEKTGNAADGGGRFFVKPMLLVVVTWH